MPRKQCQAILVVFKLHLSSSDSRFSSFGFVNMCVYLEKHFWRRGRKACSSSPFLRVWDVQGEWKEQSWEELLVTCGDCQG